MRRISVNMSRFSFVPALSVPNSPLLGVIQKKAILCSYCCRMVVAVLLVRRTDNARDRK